MTTFPKLEAAARYIEKHGWIQHTSRQKNKVCLYQALCDVQAEMDDFYEVRRRLAKGTNYHPSSMSISDWNDQSGRTKEQVLNLLSRSS